MSKFSIAADEIADIGTSKQMAERWRWLKALRSRKYKQTTGTLRSFDEDTNKAAFCCLGVLCDVVDPQQRVQLRWHDDGVATEEIWAKLGVDKKKMSRLTTICTEWNDSQCNSFYQIARKLERRLFPTKAA